MSNILVTGGAGFIGYHTAKKLSENHEVTVIDDFNEYYDKSLKKSRSEDLEKLGVKVFKTNIAHKEDLAYIFRTNKFDKICHLAGQAGVRYSIENPNAYKVANIDGTHNILEACRKYNVKNIVFASSSSVYGKNTPPFSEDQRVGNPMSYYAATKITNEAQAHSYHNVYGINAIGLRFFTVYGPYGRPDMALFKFTDGIINDKEIEIYNEGKMYRDFTYVDDIVSGVISALDKVEDLKYEIINLARGETVYLMNFVEAIEDAVGKKAKKKLLPMQDGDVPTTDGDISKAKKLLNYNPKTSVKEGVQKFVEWYKDYYGEKK